MAQWILTIVVLAMIGTAAYLVTWRQLRLTQVRFREISFQLRTAERSRTGAVVCDYVDGGTLRTLATQWGVKPRPEEIESVAGRKEGITAKLGVAGTEFGASVEGEEAMKTLYRLPFDPNSLVDELLGVLETRGALRTDLASRPVVGLEELREVAERGAQVGEGGQRLVQVERLLEDLLAAAKRKQFESVRNDEFLLIETDWNVTSDQGGARRLELARLGTGDAAIEMPRGVSLLVPTLIGGEKGTENVNVTAQGWQRIAPGDRITASVLGFSGPFNSTESRLTVIPIAIFRRVGGAVLATRTNNPDFD
jgi:hypothetical protein